jgi:hypothetical protein
MTSSLFAIVANISGMASNEILFSVIIIGFDFLTAKFS